MDGCPFFGLLHSLVVFFSYHSSWCCRVIRPWSSSTHRDLYGSRTTFPFNTPISSHFFSSQNHWGSFFISLNIVKDKFQLFQEWRLFDPLVPPLSSLRYRVAPPTPFLMDSLRPPSNRYCSINFSFPPFRSTFKVSPWRNPYPSPPSIFPLNTTWRLIPLHNKVYRCSFS